MTAVVLLADAYLWYEAYQEGTYWPKASFLFPFFACLFASVIIDPTPMKREENIKKYGQPQIPMRHMPLAQKIFTVLGVLLGITQCSHFAGHI